MLLNILDMLADFNLMSLIHMSLKQTNAFTDLKSQLLIADMEAITSLKEMKMNSQKDFIMLDQLLSHSKSSLDSRTMQEVFTLLITVEKLLKMLIMQSWLLDLELKRELNSGILRILGVHHGVFKDISRWKEELTCVLLLNAIPILLLTGIETLKPY